jgi:hypothetical protein
MGFHLQFLELNCRITFINEKPETQIVGNDFVSCPPLSALAGKYTTNRYNRISELHVSINKLNNLRSFYIKSEQVGLSRNNTRNYFAFSE